MISRSILPAAALVIAAVAARGALKTTAHLMPSSWST